MSAFVDLTGKRFEKLVAQWPVGMTRHYRPHWLCLCDCGTSCIVQAGHLRSRHSKSCGCLKAVQIPGKAYTFVNEKTGERDSGILPSERGVSNEFARWTTSHCWESRKYEQARSENRRLGRTSQGLVTRMKYLISAAAKNALKGGYKPYLISPEEMVQQWEQQLGKCLACGQSLDLFKAAYHHDHETGEGFGFLHQWCNCAEGRIKVMSNEEFSNFIRYVRPDFVEENNERKNHG